MTVIMVTLAPANAGRHALLLLTLVTLTRNYGKSSPKLEIMNFLIL